MGRYGIICFISDCLTECRGVEVDARAQRARGVSQPATSDMKGSKASAIRILRLKSVRANVSLEATSGERVEFVQAYDTQKESKLWRRYRLEA